jgi:hypothetical protein
MKERPGAASLALAAVTGVIAFALFLAGAIVLWTLHGAPLGWALLGLGTASVAATAMLTVAGTRPV